jgi:GNAT superfamily N-acetyltransferase
MTPVQRYLTSAMSDWDLKAVYALLWQVWPGQGSFEEAFVRFKNRVLEKTENAACRPRFTIWKDGQVVAHASIFARDVHTEAGSIRLGALSAVCTHPGYRGQGFGARVVRAAFDLIDNGTFPVSLWMTTVPVFYEKLGARIVENTWINRRSTENPLADPWPDEQKMIYPAGYDWPAGQIDLNGPPY